MTIDIAAVEKHLAAEESEVLHAYTDSEGYTTIGVGRMIDLRKKGGISQDESRYLLRNDIRKFQSECERFFDWYHDLDEVRRQVIVCMAFQLGTVGVAEFAKMISAIQRGDYQAAGDEMERSAWHVQTKERCERMAAVMRSGVWA